MGKNTRRSIEEWNEILSNNNSTLTVLDYTEKRNYFECKCNKCNQLFIKTGGNLLKHGCVVCANKKIIKGINDVATTNPELVVYFKNKEDAFKCTIGSSKKMTFICPDCGAEKVTQINTINHYGFACPVCSNKISKPNRFLRSVLMKSPVDNLKFEYETDWSLGKRYDAYFEYQGIPYIIEMDGVQHFRDTNWGTAEEQQNNDKLKEEMAVANGIKVIRIDCRTGRYDDMITNIINSELYNMFLSKMNIDWNECIDSSEESLLLKICDYYESNNHPSSTDIANYFKISDTTARFYLNEGQSLGYCTYNYEEARKHIYKHKKKEIDVRDGQGNLIGTYKGYEECYTELNKLYPDLKFTRAVISNAVNYKTHCYGLDISFHGLSFEDQFKDNEELKLICDYYKTHTNTEGREMSKLLSISETKIYSYLRIGNKLGLCKYSSTEAHRRTAEKGKENNIKNNGRKIKVFDSNGNEIGFYPSLAECERKLKERFEGFKLSQDSLSNGLVRNNGNWTRHGFTFMYA